MKVAQTTNKLSAAAIIAIAAGLLTGALWETVPMPGSYSVTQAGTSLVDPSIATITIVGKRLTAAEKRQLTNAGQSLPYPMVGALRTQDGPGAAAPVTLEAKN